MSMLRLIISVWPLLLGILLMLLSHGLFSVLLTLRASIEEYSSSTIGIIILAYPLGMVIAALRVPKLVSNVGHIRVFAALASIASSATLVAFFFVDPIWWTFLRLVLGFANTGLYIVGDSWLNTISTNSTRGKLLSVYMVVQYAALMIGSFLINLDSPEAFTLFALSSLLLSFALLPLLLTRIENPQLPESENMSLRALWKISPSGIILPFFVGTLCFTIITMATVFASKSGFTTFEVSLINVFLVLGGVLGQYPIGWLSDRMDRRIVIMMSASIALVGLFFVNVTSDPYYIIAAFFLIGAGILPTYSLAIAHINDRLTPGQMVTASGTLYLLNGAGGVFGPYVSGTAMDFFGVSQGFTIFLVTVLGFLIAYNIKRVFVREAATQESSDAFISPLPATPVTIIYTEEEIETHESIEEQESEEEKA